MAASGMCSLSVCLWWVLMYDNLCGWWQGCNVRGFEDACTPALAGLESLATQLMALGRAPCIIKWHHASPTAMSIAPLVMEPLMTVHHLLTCTTRSTLELHVFPVSLGNSVMHRSLDEPGLKLVASSSHLSKETEEFTSLFNSPEFMQVGEGLGFRGLGFGAWGFSWVLWGGVGRWVAEHWYSMWLAGRGVWGGSGAQCGLYDNFLIDQVRLRYDTRLNSGMHYPGRDFILASRLLIACTPLPHAAWHAPALRACRLISYRAGAATR